MRPALFALLFLLTGCQNQGADQDAYSSADVVEMEAMQQTRQEAAGSFAPQPPSSPARDTTSQKIIRTATLRLRVDDYARANAAVAQLVGQHNGLVASESESSYESRTENRLTVRVPSSRFQALLDALIGLAEAVEQKDISAEDVTEQFVDMQARLRAKRAVEQRYLDLLGQARNVEEVLAVETQLRQVQEEIESVEGRLRYLSDRVSYSTIHLTFYEGRSGLERPGFWQELAQAFREGWQGLLSVLVGLVYLWPLWLVLVPLLWLIYQWRLHHTRKPPERPVS